jgi:5-(carboxyamino)imidazole ribonucleotide mutase
VPVGHDGPREGAPIAPEADGTESGAEPDVRSRVVGVVMGSDSDLPVLQRCLDLLDQFDVPYEVSVLSAHRTPERAHEYATTARLRGLKILVAAAGGAAHLAGVMASLTTIPVIGVPMPTASLGGADSLYSTVQMPAGIPVATVAIGEAGAANAALLAVEILALEDEDLLHRLQAYRAEMRRKVAEKNERLQEMLSAPR